ncbi:hypothetical protein [Yinghuangia sp. YIM S10712]|uniref:hypothetical protein n=1 Tax=Yinghuangia sp. YIM S10712 TaxID=3436930 RepID=UPI003F5366CD
MSTPAASRPARATMTLAVYRLAPDGTRTDVVTRRTVTGSWLDLLTPTRTFPPCGCRRCTRAER